MEPSIPMPERISRLLAHLRSPQEIARWEAVTRLAAIGPQAVPGLLALLNGADGSVRGYAAVALGRIGDVRALPALMDNLATGDALTRRLTARALGRLGHADGVQPLIAALRDPQPGVRYDAAEALGWLGDARAVKALTRCLGDPHPEVPPGAALALGRIGAAPAVGPLLEALQTTDSSLLRAVRFALRRMRDPAAIPYLHPYLNHPHPKIRITARDLTARLRRDSQRRW
jgi:HEAT repeat protein